MTLFGMIMGKADMDPLGSVHLAVAQATGSLTEAPREMQSVHTTDKTAGGFLVVNADDWGRDTLTTDRILDCSNVGAVSSVSAMVFMEDSERAATLACENGIDAGLHLNFTSQFTALHCSTRLLERQRQLRRHLLRHRLAQLVFHPGLVRSFEYVVAAQLDEFRRIYGTEPTRIDGHHHMHLCANVVFQRLLPPGTMVRRHFSFEPGERSLANRLYRRTSDLILSRRHVLPDFFFSLAPLEPAERLNRIYSLARNLVVELETHPVQPEEYRYLAEGEIFRQIGETWIAPRSALSRSRPSAGENRS